MLRHSLLSEINTWVWLRDWSTAVGQPLTLAEIPEAAWDELASLGFDAVWLMGVWERSPAGRKLALAGGRLLRELQLQDASVRVSDVVGSPYCIRRYVVDARIGGPGGLAAARHALARRHMRLLLDFVPNHLAPDHPWVKTHPEWFIQGSPTALHEKPEAFVQLAGHIIARGRDPYFPPWSDVLQLNVFNLDQRRATIAELRAMAEQCDGVRCDMAMLVMNEVFLRTWGAHTHSAPAEDYWPSIISALRSSHPRFEFFAEAYWDLERALLQQGFDACYDKALLDQLAHGSPGSIREHLVRFGPIQDRLVRFLENHDEARAARAFPGAKGAAAAVILLTLPGVRLLHDGQLDGRTIRTPVHLDRRAPEPPDPLVKQHYTRLLQMVREQKLHDGEWALCETEALAGEAGSPGILAWIWRRPDQRWLIGVNYSAEPTQAWVELAGLATHHIGAWSELLSSPETTLSRQSTNDGTLRLEFPAWGWGIWTQAALHRDGATLI